jgi:hypothetical protein
MGQADHYQVVFDVGCNRVRGRPLWSRPYSEGAHPLRGPSSVRESVVSKVERVHCTEWERRDLIVGSGGGRFHYSVFSGKWEHQLELQDHIDDHGQLRSRMVAWILLIPGSALVLPTPIVTFHSPLSFPTTYGV